MSPTCRGYEIITMLRVRNLSKVEVWRQANLSCSLMKKYGEDRNRKAETEFNKSMLSKTTVVNIFKHVYQLVKRCGFAPKRTSQKKNRQSKTACGSWYSTIFKALKRTRGCIITREGSVAEDLSHMLNRKPAAYLWVPCFTKERWFKLRSFHDVQITSTEIFLQGIVLIYVMRRWMLLWNYFEMFIVFCSVTERHEKNHIFGTT